MYEKERNKICLIILDFVMPEMDGERCFKAILKIDPDVKIILLTGFTTDQTVFDMAQQYAVEIMEKPFDLFELTRAIEKILGEPRNRKRS